MTHAARSRWCCRCALGRIIGLIALLCLVSSSAAAFTLNVVLEDADNRPFEYLDTDGHLTGFHVELVRLVCADLGWQVSFHRIPWLRAQAQLESGAADAVTYMGKTAARERYAVFLDDNILHWSAAELYIRTERQAEIHWEPPIEHMVEHWNFGIPQGYFLGDDIEKLPKSIASVDHSARSLVELFNMLLSDRIDVAVASVAGIDEVAQNIPDIALRVRSIARLKGGPMYIAFTRHDRDGDPAHDFARAYAAWRKTPAYAGLIERFGVARYTEGALDLR